MFGERYSIEVSDDMVLIYGNLTIREAFDFLSFFDQQGYQTVGVGQENSTFCLTKEDCVKQLKEIKDDYIELQKNLNKQVVDESFKY